MPKGQIDLFNTESISNKFPTIVQTENTTEEPLALDSVDAYKAQNRSLERITVRKGQSDIHFPLDKVNSNVWNMLDLEQGEQISIGVESKGSTMPLNIYYSIAFEDDVSGIKVSKQLTPYDKRIYFAVASLYKAGNSYITYGQIYNAMGFNHAPSKIDITNMEKALSKMLGAHIAVDNREEVSQYPNYQTFRYDGSLLPFERVTKLVNGQVSEGVIHLLREPPMLQLALAHKGLTTFSRQVFASPLNKNNATLMLEDYILARIAHARNGYMPKKMLFQTIFDNANLETKMQRQRAKSKITKLLEHYKACGLISSYTEDAGGITLELPSKPSLKVK